MVSGFISDIPDESLVSPPYPHACIAHLPVYRYNIPIT